MIRQLDRQLYGLSELGIVKVLVQGAVVVLVPIGLWLASQVAERGRLIDERLVQHTQRTEAALEQIRKTDALIGLRLTVLETVEKQTILPRLDELEASRCTLSCEDRRDLEKRINRLERHEHAHGGRGSELGD